MKKLLTGCLSVLMLMAIAKVLIAQPTMEDEGMVANAVTEELTGTDDFDAMNEVISNAMEANMEIEEESAY